MHTDKIEWKNTSKSLILSLLMLVSALTAGLESFEKPSTLLEEEIQAEYEIMKNKVPKYLPFAVPDVPLYFRFGQPASIISRKIIGESSISFINWPVKNPMEVKE